MLIDIKRKAVRSALVSLSVDELVTLSNHAGDETIVGLTNFILDNSAFASTSLVNAIKKNFAYYVDEHSLALLPNIMKVVNECERNFIAEDWDVLIENLFPTIKMFDRVVYTVTVESETNNSERCKGTYLFSTYEKAKIAFLNQRAIICNMGNWENVEVDDDTQYQVQNNHWGESADVYISKSIVY